MRKIRRYDVITSQDAEWFVTLVNQKAERGWCLLDLPHRIRIEGQKEWIAWMYRDGEEEEK